MVNQVPIAAPGVPPVPPPVPDPGGGVPMPPQPAPPNRASGGLPIAVIAAVQQVYLRESQKQGNANVNGGGPVPLQPGWGGQGR